MRRLVGPALGLLDAACISLGLLAAWALWTWRSPNLGFLVQVTVLDLWGPNRFITAGFVVVAAWLAVLTQLGMHDPGRLENSARIAGAVTRSAVWVAAMILVENFLIGERVYPKGLVAPFIGITWGLLLGARLLVFRIVLRLERPPTAMNAAIVGIGEDGLAMAQRMERDARHVVHVAGYLRTDASGPPRVDPDRILGSVHDLTLLVNRHRLGMIIVATRTLPREDALRMAVLADRLGLRVLQAPFSWGVVSPRIGLARLGGLDLIDLVSIRYPTLAEQVKRTFDLTLVLVGGLLISPVLLVIAGLVRLNDSGPVFYISPRTGRGGRIFGFIKFRSMVVDADTQRDDLTNEADGRLFKMKDDPRVTPLGRFLRKYSLDELPQLLNVLRGDMNLVGPRPLPARDLEGIESDSEMQYWFDLRSKVHPGITGLWQVSGRSDTGFAEMVRHDIHYIQNWSLWLDLQILAKTLPAVLRGRGAV